MTEHKHIIQQVSDYYTQRLAEHGQTHWGVDWNSTASQYLRFAQLLKIHATPSSAFSINDYGCGYGALVNYLTQQDFQFEYTGLDIAPAMVEAARQQFPSLTFVTDHQALAPADYTVASGIFNVQLQTADSDWYDYILTTLSRMWQLSKKGMAFNCLTSYSDAEYMRDYLYYTNPLTLFDYCHRHFSKQVALLHDYGLYEFTILVRSEIP